MAAPRYKQIDVSLIIVNRDERQRRELVNLEELADSIRRLGVINPITIKKDYTLIAGERRLEACKLISDSYQVPCRFYEELDDVQLQLVELEENLKRSELSWQDKCISVHRIHNLYQSMEAEWNAAKTGGAIGISSPWVSEMCMIADRLIAGDPKVVNADSQRSARNIISRENERSIDNELNNLLEIEREDTHDSGLQSASVQSDNTTITSSLPGQVKLPQKMQPAEIECGNFKDYIRDFSGRRFNFIHCDFPYGINHGNSDQGGTATGRYDGYEDSEDTYWGLCLALCSAIPEIMTSSGHVMFWMTMKFYTQTVEFFHKHSDLTLVMEHPLIWYKSDGRGIVSDVERRPRNVYETALLFSRGDRKILTPVDNCYACPTAKSKALHVSEKPEPMLRHFFRMFVDGYCEMLDPTCGAGSALRAADSLGAKRLLGIELNPEFASEAQSGLKRARTLSKLSSTIGDPQ